VEMLCTRIESITLNLNNIRVNLEINSNVIVPFSCIIASQLIREGYEDNILVKV